MREDDPRYLRAAMPAREWRRYVALWLVRREERGIRAPGLEEPTPDDLVALEDEGLVENAEDREGRRADWRLTALGIVALRRAREAALHGLAPAQRERGAPERPVGTSGVHGGATTSSRARGASGSRRAKPHRAHPAPTPDRMAP